MMADSASTADDGGQTRRDFLYLVTAGMSAVATGVALWPVLDSMNPSADVLALASIEVDLAPIEEGQRVTVKWRGKPVFIDHRSAAQIEEAAAVNLDDLRDPQSDADRATKPEWLILVGVCTHLGCVPLGQGSGDTRGEYGGWFCPCHGSHYDTSGRIRKGPAPENLLVPDYRYLEDDKVVIG